MSTNKPCQHCSKRLATKRVEQAIHVKDIQSGSYGDSLASSSFKFELCDVCSRLFMDTNAIQMRNYALDLTKDGEYRTLLQSPGNGLDKLRTEDNEDDVIDVEAEVA